MRQIRLLIMVLTLLIAFSGCERPKEEAIGYDDVITVVCDERNWEACEPILAETFGKIYQTPPTESLYEFRRIDASDLSANILNKNIMILTRLENTSSITPQVRSMLPDSTITNIRNNPRGYYYQNDPYARGQALIVVVGKSLEDLRSRVEVNQNQMFDFVEKTMYKRNTAFVYRSGEQFELAESYFNQYGFYLRMMHDYVEIENSSKKQLVWLGRDFPYRWLAVSWEKANENTLETQLEKLLKSTFGSKLGSIKLNEEYLVQEPIWFKQFSAIKYYGLWESKQEVKGGPFIAYGFYEPLKDRIYLISGIVHAPEKAKLPYIRQMETIIRTFDTEIFESD
ncbi:MAG: DUF4837 family protein [Candidatus Marinimicrobia bacterium]|nr:DUF4837 family protein [Candidatus Neomarinimicrobiota bacterium]